MRRFRPLIDHASHLTSAQGDGELEDGVGVVEGVAVEVAELVHPVPHGLRVHEQRGGDVLAAAVVEQPGAEGVGELLGHGRAQVGEGRQRPRAQVGEGLRVGGQHQPGQVVLGVAGETVGVGAERAVVRRPHLEPRTRGPGDAPARGQRGEQPGPPPAVGVGHEEQRRVVRHVAPVDGLEHHAGQGAAYGPRLRLRHDHGRQRGRRRPLGAVGRLLHVLGRRPVEQVGGQPLEQPLAHAAGRGQLVGVAGHARGRQLVDVGEHQLGEPGEPLGRDAGGHGARGHLPPGHPGADAVGGQQRVGGASVARLAAAELVGALHGRRGRRPGVGAAPPARQGQEPAQRELHGVADDLAHAAAERALVAGDLVDDGRHGAVGHVGQVGAHVGDHLGREEDTVTSGTSWSARGHFDTP